MMYPMIIKHWKGKFSCPVCDEFHKDESWYMLDHLKTHDKSEIINCLFGEITDIAMGDRVWVIDDC